MRIKPITIKIYPSVIIDSQTLYSHKIEDFEQSVFMTREEFLKDLSKFLVEDSRDRLRELKRKENDLKLRKAYKVKKSG